jgi:uncharacterized metal-binding protein YceD (DUF177 family)
MRIKSSQISSETRVTLTGEEPWLGSIYDDFPTARSTNQPLRITGYLNLIPENGSIKVTGSLDFVPIVSCARCDKSIPWPVKVSVETVVLPEDSEPLPRDLSLGEEEVDCYYLSADELDLEILVNDAIQTALPSQFVAASEDGKSCKICHIDISQAKVFTAGETDSTSPFAALKDLKLRK